MKSAVIIAFAIFFIATASAVSAGVADTCSVDKLDIETIATEITTKVEMTYYFECQPTAEAGQINKMLITVPYDDVYNVEAEDGIGSMKVFEGPEYASAINSDTESTVGSFFRKAIVLDPNGTVGYMLTLNFQSDVIVKESEKIFTIVPKGLGVKPKITAVSTGVTETIIPIDTIDYKLTMPEGSAVTSSPSGCALAEGTVTCTGLSAAQLDELEVKWTGTGPGVVFTKVRDIAFDLPDLFTSFFKGFKDTILDLLGKSEE
jgi:hypothetical protein|tara:strand:+ start:308 stop:1090 length:783 start_codon:yes stop_codon:yes gene_type:complete